MLVMINKSQLILANQIFLDFFDVDNIKEFDNKYKNISSRFICHDGFLYDLNETKFLNILQENENKLFHVKMKNKNGEIRHFILRFHTIPEKENFGILSFDDVSELNLMQLFDKKQTNTDNNKFDEKAIYNLLDVIYKNTAKVKVHNYYKGLSITNDAIILSINDGFITIKTTYLQQKAIQYERKAYLISQALPHTLECSKVGQISFEHQSVELKSLKLVDTSPINRKTIRVVPEQNHRVSLFIDETKFHGDISVEDISLDAIRLQINALPLGLDIDSEVIIDLVLMMDKKPLIINTKAILLRKIELNNKFNLIFMFKDLKNTQLVKYITKRQMAIIREFKGLQNG